MAHILAEWPEGTTLKVKGSGDAVYTLKRTAEMLFHCTCPAWAFTGKRKTCKHLRELLGDEFETLRTGIAASASAKKTKKRAAAVKEENLEASAAAATEETPAPKKRKAPAKKQAQANVENLHEPVADITAAGQARQENLGGPRKVLLAQKFDLDGKKDPTGWWMSEKIDGIRAYWDGHGQIWSRTGKPFLPPQTFLDELPRGVSLDGELFLGYNRFDEVSGLVRSHTFENDTRWQSIEYMVFDLPSLSHLPFETRHATLKSKFAENEKSGPIRVVEQIECTGIGHLLQELDRVQNKGGEGIMLREPLSQYMGARHKSCLKVKTFYDAEAKVIDYTPGEGKYVGSTGSLICEMASGNQFSVGSGLSDEMRANPPAIGSIITYRFFSLTKDLVPRFPTFAGIRVDKTKPEDAKVRKTEIL